MLSSSLRAFLKESQRQDILGKIFINLIPSSDSTLYILNAHMLIEELIFELIQNSSPNVRKPRDLSYQKKRSQLEAIYSDTFPVWLYTSLKLLGDLRNTCAHEIDSPKLSGQIASFVDVAYERTDKDEALLLKKLGKGYSAGTDCSKDELRWFEATAQRQQDYYFRLPMACERIIEQLLRA